MMVVVIAGNTNSTDRWPPRRKRIEKLGLLCHRDLVSNQIVWLEVL